MAKNNFSALVQLIIDKAQARSALQQELKELRDKAQLETSIKINLSDVKQARKEIMQANKEQQEGIRETIKLRAQELAYARMVSKEIKVATNLEIANRQREMKLTNQSANEELAKRKRVIQEQKVYTQEELTSRENIRKLNEQTFKEELSARRQVITETKLQAQQERALQTSLNSPERRINEKLKNNFYSTSINKIKKQFQDYGLDTNQAEDQVKQLRIVLSEMQTLSGNNLVTKANEWKNTFDAVKVQLDNAKLSFDKFSQPASDDKISSLMVKIQNILTKNTNITKEAKQQLELYLNELGKGNTSLNRCNEINSELAKTEARMRTLGKLGKSLKDQMSQAASSFTQLISVSSAIMTVVYNTKKALSELKEVDTYLTEISKANDKLTKYDLKKIGSSSFDVASNYGKKSSNYLSAVQTASRAGYDDAEKIAELSVAIQGAGDVTEDIANKYVVATDKAYNLNGAVTKLTQVFDGANKITNENAVNMSDLAEGMSIVGSTAASFDVDVNEATAALGTMIATTQQSGSEVARAFRAILLNIRQVSDEEEGIDTEGLTKYEKACNALNVKLKETKNGVLSLRDPMEVLHDLSIEYNKLDESDIRRTNLLSSVGGKVYHVIQKCVTRMNLIAGNPLEPYPTI